MKKNNLFADGWQHYAPPQTGPDQNPSESWSILDRSEYYRKLR